MEDILVKKNKALYLIISLVMMLVFCSGIVFAQDNKIVIGSIWDSIGIGATSCQMQLKGARLAVKLVNDEGGIFGYPIELHNIDGQGKLDVISNAAKRLSEDIKVVAAAGSTDDSFTSAMGPVFQDHQTVLVVGSATTPTQTRIGDYVFMAAFGDNIQGRAMAKYAYDVLGWEKVAIMWDNASAYSTYLSEVFIESFKEITSDPDSIVMQEIYQTGDVNYSAQLTRIKFAKDPIDGLIITPPLPPDAPKIAMQARDMGIELPFMFGDGADDVTIIEVGGDAVEGSIISTQFAGDHPLTANAKHFVDEFVKEYNETPGGFEALGYDALRLIMEAIDSIGKDKWDSLDLDEKRTAIRDALQAKDVFTTTTAPISYPDPETAEYPRVPMKTVVFKAVQDQQLIFLDSLDPEDIFD
jgi:branched-chain amino acid transport system substrate-binding protein